MPPRASNLLPSANVGGYRAKRLERVDQRFLDVGSKAIAVERKYDSWRYRSCPSEVGRAARHCASVVLPLEPRERRVTSLFAK
jgi:hypothetical protein